MAKVGNRFAALQPVYDAVIDRFGGLEPNVARGIKLRHDWGSQYRAHHFQGSLNWLSIEDDAAFVGEPQGISEVAEILGLRHHNSVTTYLHRYDNFPKPVVDKSADRIRLWVRQDIVAWRNERRARPTM